MLQWKLLQPKRWPGGPSLRTAPPICPQAGGYPLANLTLWGAQLKLPPGHPPQAPEVPWTSLGLNFRTFCPASWGLLPPLEVCCLCTTSKNILGKCTISASAIGSENNEPIGSTVSGGGSGPGKCPAMCAMFLALCSKDLNKAGRKRPVKAG